VPGRFRRRVRQALARLTVRWLRLLYRWRVFPLEQGWGFSRGTPIDRYYIGNFIRAQAGEVGGRVLEFGGPRYRDFFTPARIERYDIIDLTNADTRVTIVADIQHAPHIPNATFDCVVCTQVLLLIPDVVAALREIHRILKPGGLLLLTLPQTALTVPRNEFPGGDYWRFTEDSVRWLLRGFSDVRVTAHGNPLAVFAFANRIVLEDLTPTDLDWTDPRFPLHLNVYARR
jgi:SAM-dependent methyltransferase